jgi:25S rRNA (uracil2843-N3)-methyltransferase
MAGGVRSKSNQNVRSKTSSTKKSSTAITQRPSVNRQRPQEASVVDIPAHVQQAALNIFRDSLHPTDEDVQLLQEVKTHLFNRDFATAFSKQEYLRVYASRWSPSRALGYLEIFSEIAAHVHAPSTGGEDGERIRTKIVCLGGGAGAEIVGLGAWLSLSPPGDLDGHRFEAHFIDIAAWGEVIDALHKGIVKPPPLSKYASAAVRESNVALLLGDVFSSSFSQIDVLSTSDSPFVAQIQNADLVTLMFTLNELYTCSISKTQSLLVQLTKNMRPGAHLLVVDSPGSYSTVSINGAEKKYPMLWLLDHTLLDSEPHKRGSDVLPKWSKVLSEESRWFRLPPGLEYPIPLEHMRYQIHMYKRNQDQGEEVVT